MSRPALILLLLTATACGTSSRTAGEPAVERNDEPDRAAEYQAMKRAGSDDPYRSLALARERMRDLPRYSTAGDAWTAPRTGPMAVTGNAIPSLGKWRFLGPGNVGGRTRVLVIDWADSNVMYTGGVSGGIWRTTTAGAEWEPIGDDLANIAVNSLVMDPQDHRVLYAGTGEGYFREDVRGTALPLRGDGIFVTRDAGETWTQLAATSNEDFHFVNDLVVSSNDSSRLYAATRTGVWRSLDGGSHWSRVLEPGVHGGCLDLALRPATGGDTLFASCGTFVQATVWRTKQGETDGPWEAVLSELNMGRTSLAIAPSNPSIIYALSASNEAGRFDQGLLAVFRSTTDGDAGTWEARVRNDNGTYSAMLLTNVITASVEECTRGSDENVTMGWYCNTIAVDPVDPERVWVG